MTTYHLEQRDAYWHVIDSDGRCCGVQAVYSQAQLLLGILQAMEKARQTSPAYQHRP